MPGPPPWLIGDCQPDGCGLNGIWLGSGVSFRTLHLPRSEGTPGKVNEAGIRISGFKKGATDLLVDVQGQELLGKSNNQIVLPAINTAGSDLILQHVTPIGDKIDMTYDLHINQVINDVNHPFWSSCNGNCNPDYPFIYDFTVTSDDGCQIELCEPGLDGNPNNLTGKAVIFRGDRYTDDYQVFDVLPSDRDYGDVFNIACFNTDLHKLHMLRHTAASSGAGKTVAVDERTALLRLLTADYCGVGYPFTENGTPILLGFNNSNYKPTVDSHYLVDTASSVDALWTASGASCIGVPRLKGQVGDIVTQIYQVCDAHNVGHPSDCEPPPGQNISTLFSLHPNALAISGNK